MTSFGTAAIAAAEEISLVFDDDRLRFCQVTCSGAQLTKLCLLLIIQSLVYEVNLALFILSFIYYCAGLRHTQIELQCLIYMCSSKQSHVLHCCCN